MAPITKPLLFVLVLVIVSLTEGQLYAGSMRWCTINTAEQEKCLAFNETLVNRDNDFNVGFDAFFINCVQGEDVDGCIRMVDQGQADLMTLDPGQVFIGGRYHNLVPIMQEQYKGDSDHYYAVAVVKAESDIRRLSDIRGKKACFPRVGDLAGWVLPITKLIAKGVMKIADCNNHVRSVSEFFGQSCAIGSLTSRYNPLGDNSNKLCELCGSLAPGRWCSDSDPYANMEGALRCLAEVGDIAFLKHTTVLEVLATARRNGSAQLWQDGGDSTVAETPESLSESSFELLCLDGRRAPLSNYLGCNWGRVPSHAVVTSSTQSQQQRNKFQRYLQRAVSALGTRSSQVNGFSLFDSARYGVRPNLMFQDATISLRDIPQSDQLYLSYLGPSEVPILDIHSCPVKTIRMCVTSLAEAVKCDQMRQALRARLLKPELLCTRPRSYVNCMREIYSGVADIAMLDAGDVYTAGLYFDLIPIMNEAYDKDKTFFYAVAVAKELDLTTDLLYLKNKFTCHTGVMQGAGWVIPMAYLISNQRIRGYGCDSLRAASQAFTKSCAPGALNSDYRMGDEWYNLCQLCHGSSRGYCARDADEEYYGHTGAFRCLVEGGGDVAFMKHTTVMENTDGKRKEFWSRNQLAADYQLLCRDGTRGRIQDFATCNIGKVRTNAMVTRGGSKRNDVEIDTILNLFMHAQQHFGQKFDNDFSFRLFHSDEPYADLIFSDAAQQILPLPKSEQHYRPYLGEQFLQARSVVDCYAGASALYVSIAMVVVTTLLTRLLV